MQPPLAAVLSHVLFRGEGWAVPSLCSAVDAAVEFVAVPAHVGDRRGSSRLQPVKGGAGLETDLSDLPHNDRLPSEFRALLPQRGLVNYMEATAVVRALERLDEAAPLPAVITLYAAQADLIRLLIARSPKLASRSVPRVDVPAAFREQEADTVFVSLTRSHSHRSVTLGEGPALLTVALTRARRRLVVFGDVGTLARRGQWSGSVDHLDESAAGQERDIVVRLLDYIHGHGPHRDRFAIGQGMIFMKAAPPLVFPSSRVLAGWWRQLAPFAPQALAVGHLLLHHVEALVQTERRTPLDPLARFVLRALISAPLSLDDLEERLHIGRQLVRRVLGELTTADLVQADNAERWSVTAAGDKRPARANPAAAVKSAGPFISATCRRRRSFRSTWLRVSR